MGAIHRRAALLGLALLGCVLGFRGQVDFDEEHDLDGVQTLRLELPSTPITVHGCDASSATCMPTLRYDGRWLSVGGTRQDAEASANVPSLVLDRTGSFAVLRAVIPLAVSGEVELEMADIRIPSELDLEIRTRVGDVTLERISGHVDVEIEAGHVLIEGADAGLAVTTKFGDITVASAGSVELHTGDGEVRLRQTGEARGVQVTTDGGAISVELADDANLDLLISTRGVIEIDTPRISSVTHDNFERRLGDGSVEVRLISKRGRVDVTLGD